MNTHADKTQENKSQSFSDSVSLKQNGTEPTFQYTDNRTQSVVQRKLREMADNSQQVNQLKAFHEVANNIQQTKRSIQLQADTGVQQNEPVSQNFNSSSFKNTNLPVQAQFKSIKFNNNRINTEPTTSLDSNEKSVFQRVEKNIIVTGLSHLVQMDKKSLQASNVEKEIHHGQEMVIETGSKIKSRRGPNKEDYKKEDEKGEHIYNWFKVVSIEGKPVEANFYIREDVFEDVKSEKRKGKFVKRVATANTVVDEFTKVPGKLIGNEGITGVADALNDKTVFTNTGGGSGATDNDKMHAKNMGIVGDSITGITGLLAMANGFASLGDPEATSADLIEKALDIEQGAMKTGESVSKLVHTASGSATPTTASKFGSAFEGYGAAFSGIKEAFMGMRKMVNLINEYQDYSTPEKAKAAGEISIHAFETAKSIVLSIKAFMELIDGSASGHLMAAVPGLDIAISGGKIIMQAYYLIISNKSRKEMNDQRNALSNNNEEDKSKMIEASDNYRKYDAAISNKKKIINDYEEKLANPGKKTDTGKLKLDIIRLKKEVTELEKYKHEISRDDVAEFTMVTELRDANRKRVVRQGIHIATEMAKIAGAIATLSGVGAMGGGIVKGAAAATDLALPVTRLAKQKGRDIKASKQAKAELNEDDVLKKGKFYNLDTTKSSVAKNDFRVKQVKYLIRLIVDLVYKNPKNDKKDFDNVKLYLKAAGVNKKKLFSKNGDPKKQIGILLDAFQQREL